MSNSRLNQEQKDWVIKAYQERKLTQVQIASIATVSPRTINRVIAEAGLSTPVQRLNEEAAYVMKLLKEYNCSIPMLKTMFKEYARALELKLVLPLKPNNHE